MSDDNIRHLWSEAELDDAFAALHPQVHTDAGELDRARAKLLRAAAGESGDGLTAPASPSKKRSGAWRWIAVAAAVAVLTGGVVVASNLGDPSEVRPATTPTSDNRPVAGQYTHVTNDYTVLEWVSHRSVFAVRERLEVWIPPDPREVWKRRWTRTGQATIIGGMPADQAALPGPASEVQTAAAGVFTESIPGSPGWTAAPEGWHQPTAEFIAGLPSNPAQLLLRIAQAAEAGPFPGGPVPLFQPVNVDVETAMSKGAVPPVTSNRTISPASEFPISPPAAVTTPLNPSPAGSSEGQAGLALSVLTSGLAPRPLRQALVTALAQMHGVKTTGTGGTVNFAFPAGDHELLITVDAETSTVLRASTVATNSVYGLSAGRAISTSAYRYDITDGSGD
ncbi:hypothetical protein [Amycolatopsis saalfeldensis]|uniref:Uncharacterized protein n=1 Tax=Amycolatopsis saalfeldensis TaxID=394193 RepID=A0A1H8WDM4_9PSEU|nr:hypothetical protein [Amycolatopsis saalfeldensis]SEP25613.1 hypothetical protein SAMN04489732_10590 [Amycolatopsis saalfeldensis]